MTAEPARAADHSSQPTGAVGQRRRSINRLVLPQAGWLLLILVVGAALLWPVSQLYIRALGGRRFGVQCARSRYPTSGKPCG